MSKFWNPMVKNLVPYVPGEQPKIHNLIKLNTNESPYGPSPKALAAIAQANNESLRLYPDPNAELLKQAIATRYQVRPQEVFVGNGSDEVLAHTFLALLKHDRQGDPLLFPDITYSFYPVYCQLYGIAFQTVPLGAHFLLQLQDYLDFNQGKNSGVIFPNPNAPTGRALSRAEIAAFLQKNTDSVVVVDEAYVDFGAESAVSLVAHHPNLLVVHTLSKGRALAGLRVGYAIGAAELIEGLERVKNSFNSYPLGRLAQAAAVAAVEDDAYLQASCARVVATRTRTVQALEERGFSVVPSAANFIFITHPVRDAAQLAAELRAQNIIVRHFKLPRIEQYLRVTIGTDTQMDAFLRAVDEASAVKLPSA